jgi:hypothetical protein
MAMEMDGFNSFNSHVVCTCRSRPGTSTSNPCVELHRTTESMMLCDTP